MASYVQIEWLCADIEEARVVVDELLNKRWIACANIIQNVESHYTWKGKQEESVEVQVLMKSDERCFDKIAAFIQTKCSYETPPILMFQITQANKSYLDFLAESITV